LRIDNFVGRKGDRNPLAVTGRKLWTKTVHLKL